MRKSPFLVISIAAAALATWASLGMPIPPVPLWHLVSKAELIVVAEVSGVDRLERRDDDWNTRLAKLRVIEVLKGPRHDTVEVPFPGTLLCPAPPRYEPGETVVAFLSRDEGRWQTESLSYGTLYPRGADLEDVKTMVRAALAIHEQRPNVLQLTRSKRKWLVQAAALPGTRWHGLYEMAPGGDHVRRGQGRGGQGLRLTPRPEQKALLADALVEAMRVDHTLPMMLRQLADHPDPRVDMAALGVLEGMLLLDELPWWTWGLVSEVLKRHGEGELQARLDARGFDSSDFTPDELRGFWGEAKAELDIPEVAPIEVELEPGPPR